MEAVEQAQWIALDTLKLWTRNYNSGDIGAISNSIKRFGFNKSVRAWNGVVMAGNHSIKALRQLQADGWQPSGGGLRVIDGDWYVSVIDVSHLSEQEAEAFAIADNRTAELASHDDVALAELLQEMALADMSLMRDAGYDGDDLDMLLAELGAAYDDPTPDPGGQIDRAAELQAKWQTERGQVWQVGAHRIMCGDSTDAGDVARLMGGVKADMVFTDPPYNVTDNDWDKFTSSGFMSFLNDVVANITTSVSDEGSIYICLNWRFVAELKILLDTKFTIRNWIIWHHISRGANFRFFTPSHQDILFYTVGDKYHFDPILELEPYAETSIERDQYNTRQYVLSRNGKNPSDVWYFPQVRGNELDNQPHPTQKPIKLVCRAVHVSSRVSDIVLDLFLGSGTTLVACEQTGRVGYGMEIDAGYTAVCLERLTGMGLEAELSD